MLSRVAHIGRGGSCSLSTATSRWKSSSAGDDYQYWQRSKVPTMHFQKSLPRLPIPELPKTCERYLKAQRPLLSDENFKKTEDVVNRFLHGEGMILHKELKNHDAKNKHTSYISEPWFDMYLRDRVPLPINYNPVLCYIDDPRKEYNDQLIRSTNMLISSLRFMKSLREGILEPEVFHLNPKKSDTDMFRAVTRILPSAVSWYGAYMFSAFPLDMSQYEGLFNATRIPCIGKDRIYRDPAGKHMLIMRNGNLYVFDVLDAAGNILEPELIMACVKYILEDQAPAAKYPLGMLTTESRDTWAAARKHIENNGNANVLQLIDSSIFCLCLDDKAAGDEPEHLMRSFLHSDGVNRWFDKSFSLLVARDGKAAVNFEHSWGDGVAILRYFQDIFKDSTKTPRVHPHTNPADCQPASLVRKLEINLDGKAIADITAATEKYNTFTKSLGVNTISLEGFGKKLCKTAKLSPDSVMQLGFQLAYNKLSGRYVGTYESCSTAAFKHGRTETMRPCTTATKAFCEAMRALSKPSLEQLMGMLSTCSQVHGNLTKEAAMGQGFDRHLFGLRKMSEKRGGPLPALYQDPAYAYINHNIISTSTLASDMLLVGGFGPVVKDGLGIGYSILDDRLGAMVTNYPAHSDGPGFARCLEEAFTQIYDILLAASK